MSGTTDFISDSLDGLISQCSVEVRLNSTLSSATTNNGSSIYDTIVNSMCPNDCKYDGEKTGDCVNGMNMFCPFMILMEILRYTNSHFTIVLIVILRYTNSHFTIMLIFILRYTNSHFTIMRHMSSTEDSHLSILLNMSCHVIVPMPEYKVRIFEKGVVKVSMLA